MFPRLAICRCISLSCYQCLGLVYHLLFLVSDFEYFAFKKSLLNYHWISSFRLVLVHYQKSLGRIHHDFLDLIIRHKYCRFRLLGDNITRIIRIRIAIRVRSHLRSTPILIVNLLVIHQ